MAWMNDESLRQTLETGRTVVLEPVAARSTGARARRRATASTSARRYYDCDGDTLLFVVEQEGKGACHTGEHSCFFRALRRRVRRRRDRRCRSPTPRPSSTTLAARLHGRARCGASCSPTSITPVAAFARLCRDASRVPARVGRARRALEPVVVRRPPPAATLVARGRRASTVDRRRCPTAIRARPGHPRRRRGAARALPVARARDLPPLHGGLVGYLGYDVVREVEHLPDVPADDRGCPTRCCRSSASWPPSTTSASGSR